MIQAQPTWKKEQRTHMHDIITLTRKLGATAAIVAYCKTTAEMTNPRKAELQELAKEIQWDIYEDKVKNTKAGGHVEANTHYFVLAPNDITTAWKNSSRMDDDAPEAMETIVDVNDGINRYQVKVMEELKQPGDSYFAQVKGWINIAPYGEDGQIHKVYGITYPLPNLATKQTL
jgi:hypothetical protein